ncbi:dolichyl-diphosphooligosaccharide--protein glycosyltransferase subunit DAD1 [Hyalella azteca]|uniref:Dolichyl-diphosphooligosaccharide--protein glycosyltransferase subunit DAD1 n=1 Tax=Hyalella azteca TaxID=294128 RepID=A0A8B7NGC2_HYAAZ|nr:dolichyl-diphosphooligosaccharide--protein glycosyltransferase subunit DAD1 [Hyalella azteca]
MAHKVAGQKSGNAAASSTAAASSLSLATVLHNFQVDYQKNTPKRLKMVDAYLLYILLTGVIQFAYCCLVGTFPFNSFLSGFISTVGCFVLGVCIRLQANPQNKQQFDSISPERGFADFIFAHIVLHLVIVNFIG